ncbi:MAG: class I SAM-dependent DNA methyltransferase, partial [Candidatus Thorarchaeota archaeon]
LSSRDLLMYLDKVIRDFENEKDIGNTNQGSLGVIYTPKFVVDYMISNVFKLYFEEFFNGAKTLNIKFSFEYLWRYLSKNPRLKLKFIRKLKNIKILDPACGSGRFMVSTAEKLYQFYKILNSGLNDYEIKRFILQENLYGIEIEKSAYIIAKLQLIFWLFSGNESPIILPNFNTKSLNLEEINQIINKLDIKFNLFNIDFLLEFTSGKFDIIMGNPPYVENKKINLEYKKQLYENFYSAYKLFDVSVLFIEKSIELMKKKGYTSFILPNKFLSADYGLKIRERLIENIELKEIVNISSISIFQKAATYPIILYYKKDKPSNKNVINIRKFDEIGDLLTNNSSNVIKIPQKLINNLPSNVIPISGRIDLIEFLNSKFKSFEDSFKDLKIIYRPFGFLKYNKYFDNVSKESNSDKDLLLIGTGNVGKDHIKFNKRIKIAKRNLEISYFNYKPTFKPIWQDLYNEKIIFREIAKELTCVYDSGIFTNITGLYFVRIPSINTEMLYCLATLLNSKLLDSIFKTLFSSLHMAGGYLRFNGSFIKRLPMPRKFPLSLSKCGEIIQILVQLHYDLNSESICESPELKSFKETYLIKIENYLSFFKQLRNSLVNLLFLDELYLESKIDYNSTREFLYSKVGLNDIQFKYLLPRYQIDKYTTYTDEELKSTLNEIKKFFNNLCENKHLLDQISQIFINDFS